nr:hypothetical protein GCM10020063_000650 [Dactylosporangium thailandense]
MALALHRDIGSGPGPGVRAGVAVRQQRPSGPPRRGDRGGPIGGRAPRRRERGHGDGAEQPRRGLPPGRAGNCDAAREHRSALDVARTIGYADEIERARQGIEAAQATTVTT